MPRIAALPCRRAEFHLATLSLAADAATDVYTFAKPECITACHSIVYASVLQLLQQIAKLVRIAWRRNNPLEPTAPASGAPKAVSSCHQTSVKSKAGCERHIEKVYS